MNLALITGNLVNRDGEQLNTITATEEKRIFDFLQNAVLSDQEVIAYSYRPIQSPALIPVIKNLSRSKPYHIELEEYNFSRHDYQEGEPKIESRHSIPEKRSVTFRGISKVDLDDGVNSEELLVELTKSQTFLCASSFVYAPKPVIIINVECYKLR